MNFTSAILQKTYQESYLHYTESLNFLKTNLVKPVSEISDKVELSPETQHIKNLGLNLTDSFTIQKNSNIEFKYNFTDSLIQVQSKGNYNINEKSGSVNFIINLAQMSEKNGDKISILPMELNVSLDFRIVEKNYSKESGSLIQKPDMLTIIQKIVERVLDVIKDGQDKDIKLAFENPSTFIDLMQFEKGKFAKMLFAWLESISKLTNPLDEDGKRDNIVLVIPDEKWQIDYEKRNLSINIANVSINMKFQSGETQTISLAQPETAATETTEA